MTFTPAETADRTGFSLDTLRYYEKEGLLTVARTSGGRRVYSDSDLEWLGLVRCLRDTGMPIADLRRYADLSVDDSTLDDRLDLLLEHERQVVEKLEALLAQKARLDEKIAWYRSQGAGVQTRHD